MLEPGSKERLKPGGMEPRGLCSTPVRFPAPGLSDWPDPDSIFQATLEGGLNHGRFPRLLLHLGPLPPLPVQLPLEEIS